MPLDPSSAIMPSSHGKIAVQGEEVQTLAGFVNPKRRLRSFR